MNTIDLEVQGMSCGSCVKHVTQALQALTGVSAVEVDLPSGHVRVSGEFAKGNAPAIAALTAAGYPALLATSPEAPSPPGKTSAIQSGSGGRSGCCCK